MLTAEKVIGNVVTFVVQKAVTRIDNLAIDDRKKACRVLTKLYYCVQALDEVTESIFRQVVYPRPGENEASSSVMNVLLYRMDALRCTSKMFVALGHELYRGLKVIDPALSDCCEPLYYLGKHCFLVEMSKSFVVIGSGIDCGLIVKMPKMTVEPEALERVYAAVIEAHRLGLPNCHRLTWTKSSGPSSFCLTWDSKEAGAKFLGNLIEHRRCLTDAKQMLRELLRTRFTVDELLFQNDR